MNKILITLVNLVVIFIFISFGSNKTYEEEDESMLTQLENLQKNITKAFVRGPNKQASGFGLGLSISNKVVLAHGGKLTIENNNNSLGVTITLKFPKK